MLVTADRTKAISKLWMDLRHRRALIAEGSYQLFLKSADEVNDFAAQGVVLLLSVDELCSIHVVPAIPIESDFISIVRAWRVS